MSFYLSLIMAVLVLGMLSRSWKQRWLAWPQNKGPGEGAMPDATPDAMPDATPGAIARVATSVETLTAPARARVAQEFTQLRNSLDFNAKQVDLAEGFRTWATTALVEDEKVVRWLNALSPAANVAFTQQVAEFCREMGFELTALLNGELTQLPTAEQKARAIVLLYCRTNREAAFAQDEFDASKRLLAYLRAPTRKNNQRFGQNLYRKLAEHGLAQTPPIDVTKATDAEVHAQLLATIRQVAAQQPDTFTTVLAKVMAEAE
ncbi:MAG: hypothetical protein DYG89_27225 [Caldilinea sp. CFX5]|nr:hypothetical protein [Caldilinea sp. CFX5]